MNRRTSRFGNRFAKAVRPLCGLALRVSCLAAMSGAAVSAAAAQDPASAGTGFEPAPVGQWRTLTSFNDVRDLTIDGEGRVWGATSGGIFVYDPAESAFERLLTTADGLPRLDASAVEYYWRTGEVVAGFPDGMLVGIETDGFRVRDVGDIERTEAFTNKAVTAIRLAPDGLLISTGFGVVAYDRTFSFVKGSYTAIGGWPLGTPVNDLSLSTGGDSLWVAADRGVAVGALGDDLSLSGSWNVDGEQVFGGAPVVQVAPFAGRVHASTAEANYVKTAAGWAVGGPFGTAPAVTDYEVDAANARLIAAQALRVAVLDGSGTVTIHASEDAVARVHPPAPPGDGQDGLEEPADPPGDPFREPGSFWAGTYRAGAFHGPADPQGDPTPARADGPAINAARSIVFTEEGFIAASTEFSDRNSLYDNQKGFSIVQGGRWTNYNMGTDPVLAAERFTLTFKAASGPLYHYFGSWGSGIARLDRQTGQVDVFDAQTSSLRGWEALDPAFIVASGLQTDSRDDVWSVSRYASRALAHHREGDPDWTPLDPPAGVGASDLYVTLFIDSNDRKWIPLQSATSAGRGILVLDTGADPASSDDDRAVILTDGSAAGNLPDPRVNAVVEDLAGEIWVGTDRGIARFLFPDLIVDGGAAERQAQWLIAEDPGGASPFLLRDITVTAMAVNGANQKWIGTPGEGIWLLNEQGSRILAHYTTQNSPLLSNSIRDLAYDSRTGELYVSTALGLIVLTDVATAGTGRMETLTAYPNPFVYDRHERVVIDGLADRTTVMIVAVDGARMRRLESAGGRIEWDGLDDRGRPLASGVYLILALETDGRKRGAGKLVVIR